MKNEFVELIGKTNLDATVAILKTPCSPAQYYAGIVYKTTDGWIPIDNSYYCFHKTIEEARIGGKKMLRKLLRD